MKHTILVGISSDDLPFLQTTVCSKSSNPTILRKGILYNLLKHSPYDGQEYSLAQTQFMMNEDELTLTSHQTVSDSQEDITQLKESLITNGPTVSPKSQYFENIIYQTPMPREQTSEQKMVTS